MAIKFAHTVVIVKDINRSKIFYESVLEIKIINNFEICIVFEGGLVLHNSKEFNDLILLKNKNVNQNQGSNNIDVYFESDRLEDEYRRLKDKNLTFIHGIEKQSWGQKVFRFYDPDNHVVEIGEPSFVNFN